MLLCIIPSNFFSVLVRRRHRLLRVPFVRCVPFFFFRSAGVSVQTVTVIHIAKSTTKKIIQRIKQEKNVYAHMSKERKKNTTKKKK